MTEGELEPGAGTVLVADDDGDVRAALRLLLRQRGYGVVTVSSPGGVLQALAEEDYDALLLDLNYTRDTTSGREGLDLLARIREIEPILPVVVMTAWSSVESAVEAMRRGARDYVEKPWDNQRLLTTLRSQIELGRAMRAERRLEAGAQRTSVEGLPELIASSKPMQRVVALVERVGPSDANVLIRGAHGTGKEVVARWLHHLSARAEKPFIPVNAGALPDGVFESELFGHVKGAFTDAGADRAGCFEMADGGTLFLDEIGTMPLHQQAKLLRALQTGEYTRVGSSKACRADVRVLSATNAELAAKAEAGEFREDLLYRLNTVEIVLPGLRERREDVPELAGRFLAAQAAHYRKPVTGFEPEAMEALLAHDWPGNVRELEHAVERAVLLAEGERIGPGDLGLGRDDGRPARVGRELLEEMTLEEAERFLVERAMARHKGNVSRAAAALGLSRAALYRRLQRHGDTSAKAAP